MASVATVVYASVDDAIFDMDYHFAEHMPLAMDRFGSYDMTGWRVLRVVSAPSGPSPFNVVATLEFGSSDGFKSAIAAEDATIVGDVPNFINQKAQGNDR